MKISFFTLGCKLNQAETAELKKDLIKLGLIVVPYDSEEDVCVVRGCGVTCTASQKTRNIIRHIKHQGAQVIVVGCVENTDLTEIDFVAKDNEEIIKYLKQHFSISPAKLPRPIHVIERTREMIKIQTGCNFNCAYCIIPTFRGKAQSIAPEFIIKKINEAVANDYQEVVLTGVNICQYRFKIKKLKNLKIIELSDLLEMILKKTKIERIRLGSLDPRLITDKLIKLYSQSLNLSIFQSFNRLLPHWHLSLQSGSDTVLKHMNRNYTAKKYLEIINKLRAVYPLFSFTTDIIVGFPGETEKEFKQTCDFVKQASFTKVHIFPFSPRPDTPAAKMPNQVQDKIKTARAKKLATVANLVAKKYAKQFKGLTRPVLIEQKTTKDWWGGYTPEYLRAKIKSDNDLTNKIVEIKL